jgi:hypothetical protein
MTTPGQAAFHVNANAITDVRLRDSAAVSVIGRSGGTSGDPGDIVAAADNDVLRRSAGVVGFGTLDAASIGSGSLPDIRIDNNITVDEPGIAATIARDSELPTASTLSGVNAGTNLTADLEEETHASEHQHGGADEVATATPGANVIPKAGAGGFLADAFVDGSLEADEVNPTLGTQTQGNFVATVATTAPLSGGSAGSEGTAITLTTSMTTNRLIGRTTAAAGPMEEITVASPLTLTGLTLDVTAIADADLASNYSGVGACGANTFATTLNDNAAPTCTQPTFTNLSGTASDAQVSGSNESDEIDDDVMPFDDADNNFTATTVGPAIEELDDVINAGVPNSATAKVDWSELANVPAGFADGSDDGAGGAGASSVEVSVNMGDGTAGFYSSTVTGQTWVASGSEIVCNPFGTTADGGSPELTAIAGFVTTVANKSAGVGFDLMITNPLGAGGTFRFHCLGV